MDDHVIIGATCLETNKRMVLMYYAGDLWRISLGTPTSMGYDLVVNEEIILYHCTKTTSKEIITSIYNIEATTWSHYVDRTCSTRNK